MAASIKDDKGTSNKRELPGHLIKAPDVKTIVIILKRVATKFLLGD